MGLGGLHAPVLRARLPVALLPLPLALGPDLADHILGARLGLVHPLPRERFVGGGREARLHPAPQPAQFVPQSLQLALGLGARLLRGPGLDLVHVGQALLQFSAAALQVAAGLLGAPPFISSPLPLAPYVL